MENVLVLVGSGSIGLAIARRVGVGKHILLGDINIEQAKAAAQNLLQAGYAVTVVETDISARASVEALAAKAVALGKVHSVVVAAGLSPSQAAPSRILAVDLYGTALVLDVFGSVIAEGGSGLVISSQSGHRLPALSAEEDKALATTPVEALLTLPLLSQERVKDSLHAYQLSKRGNGLRVKAEAVRWGRRGARVNAISPGIIMTPLARDELDGPRAHLYGRMISASPAGRAGTPDEVAQVAALLMGPDGAFITGSDVLMDGGVTASYFYGDLAPQAD